jgi:hypothetical protein
MSRTCGPRDIISLVIPTIGYNKPLQCSINFPKSHEQDFKPFLRNFVLVFFDDILIYNKTWESRIEHVDNSLQLLRDNQSFVNNSKFSFGAREVEYLGPIVI